MSEIGIFIWVKILAKIRQSFRIKIRLSILTSFRKRQKPRMT